MSNIYAIVREGEGVFLMVLARNANDRLIWKMNATLDDHYFKICEVFDRHKQSNPDLPKEEIVKRICEEAGMLALL